MAGDFSRNSVNPPKKYSGVLMQQGRVQVDADWNEQLALQHYRTFLETCDVIGNCGTPKQGSGFLIRPVPGGGDLLISPGRFYVHGLLCDLDPEKVEVTFPAAAPAPAPGGVLKRPPIRAKGLVRTLAKVLWTDPRGQVNVPSLWLDDRQLAIGDWVEISAEGRRSLLARTINISANTASTDPNAITPNFYTLTLDHPVSGFQGATTAWLNRVVTFITQPFLHSQLDASLETSPLSGPGQAVLNLTDGEYLIALEAWQREVDALEDPHIREVALGGPDTAVRLQTTWQVHVVPYSEETSPPPSPLGSPIGSPLSSPLDCCSDFPGWDQYKSTLVTTGQMNAQAPPPGSNVPPCQLPPSAGFLGLANQLYRVEIFQAGHYNGDATLVWSRDNAMVETGIICIDSTGIVYVSDLGKDDLHSLAENDWVEIFDRDDELLGNPRFLAQITAPTGTSSAPPCAPGVGQAYTLTLTPTPTAFAGRSNLRLRRWDMPAGATMAVNSQGNPVGIPITPGWIQLENNIQVNFTPGFYAGRSYWQIPARTATGDIEWPPYEIPNTNPIPQPPLGVAHRFCRLARLTVTGGKWHLIDCRCKFPHLTDICADDICYHGNRCELQEVKTVQQALDDLGAKIRFHNKMLHGWGVVCGLAVSCAGGGAATSVNVAQGYAIDCEGNDLILDKTTPVDFTHILKLSPQQNTVPDGAYELILELNRAAARPAVLSQAGDEEACCSKSRDPGPLEPCVSFRAIFSDNKDHCETRSVWHQIFDGTLLQDFYNKCLKELIDGFNGAYQNTFVSSDRQVTNAQALASSLTNLAFQVTQPKSTSNVYVSSQEDGLLSQFYTWLQGQLHDKTYCSLLAGLPAYPPYSLSNAAMTTIFGQGFKTRLRVGPEGQRAYAVGLDNNIHVYDLASGQLAAVVGAPIPSNATGWVVQDVAFNETGSTIYAMATGTNPTINSFDSLFAVGTVNADFSITWTRQASAGAFSFVSLATVASSPNVVFAVAQGQGLWSINTAGGGLVITRLMPFNAVGHLTAMGSSLFVTANSGAVASGSFDQVQQYGTNGFNVSPNPVVYSLAGFSGDTTDDLLTQARVFPNSPQASLFVTATATGSSNTNKQLLIFPVVAAGGGKPLATVDLGEKATVRLAGNPALNALMITFQETCQIKNVTPVGNTFTLAPYCPTEVHPTAIVSLAGTNAPRNVYVLNSTSNTISVIPITMAAFTANDLTTLDTYRNNAIKAYVALLGVLLEDLKDCFCDLLLVNCPSCNEEGRLGVPLACVIFRNGSVYKVCNFEKRKYVKSFPTVEYWLSLIPVIPLVRWLFEKLCCADLPSIFAKFNVPQANNPPGYTAYTQGITPEAFRHTVVQLQGLTLDKVFSPTLSALAPARNFTLDALFQPLRAPAAAPSVNFKLVAGQPLQAAQDTLRAAKINVTAVVPYDPSDLVRNALDYATAPSMLPTGSSVTLVTDSQGLVKFYIPSSADVAQLGASVQSNQQQVETQIGAITTQNQQLQSQVAALQQAQKPALDTVQVLQAQVNTLQTQLATLQTTHASEIAARDQQIATLTDTTRQLQTRLQTVDDLAAQVKDLASQVPPKKPPKA